MGDFDPAVESFDELENRHAKRVFIKIVEPTDRPIVGNVYLAHGFSDVHDTGRMRAMTRAFVRGGVRVVLWDATNSWGRSDGEILAARFDLHHADLEDVIIWSMTKAWFEPTYWLGGFSLGGMVAGVYAARHPRQIRGLLLACPVVSGPALRRRIPLPMRWWWRVRGRIKHRFMGMSLPEWAFMESAWSYNLLAEARYLTMPVLLVGAGRDFMMPPRIVRRLARRIGAGVRLEIVSGAHHGFDPKAEHDKLEIIVREWVKQQVRIFLDKNPQEKS